MAPSRKMLVIIVCLCLQAACPGSKEKGWSHPFMDVWSVPATRKVCVDDTYEGSLQAQRSVRMTAARGEWELFQVVIRSRNEAPLSNVTVVVSDLYGPNGAVIPGSSFRLYLGWFVQVEDPSPGGLERNPREPGEYVDPLVPFYDPYDPDHPAMATPFDVQAGRAQPVFGDLQVPSDASAGVYQGSLMVIAGDGEPAILPFTLRVFDFTLPSEPTVTTSFHLGRSGIRDFHGGEEQDASELVRVQNNYEETLHRHRIDLLFPYLMSSDQPLTADASGDLEQPDWESFDVAMAPRLDGSFYEDGVPIKSFAFGLFRPGAADGLEVELNDDAYTEAASVAAEHLKERGWFDRAYIFTFDEPYNQDGAYERIAADVALIKAGDPDWEGRFMTTNHYVPGLDGAVDIWTVDTKNYDSWMWGEGTLPGRGFYAERLSQGERLWFYNCLSTIPPYATYDIDTILGHEPRILKWGAFYEGASGFLYWSVNFWVDEGPWETLRDKGTFGAVARNGDGFLLYPGDHNGRNAPLGSPDSIAIEGPIESHRLKMVREGLEDWEYFNLASQLFGREAVLELLDQAYSRLGGSPGEIEDLGLLVFIAGQRSKLDIPTLPAGYTYDPDDPPWTLDDSVLYRIREELAQMIEDRLGENR